MFQGPLKLLHIPGKLYLNAKLSFIRCIIRWFFLSSLAIKSNSVGFKTFEMCFSWRCSLLIWPSNTKPTHPSIWGNKKAISIKMSRGMALTGRLCLILSAISDLPHLQCVFPIMHIKEGAPCWHKLRAFRQFFCGLSMHHLKWWAVSQQWWMLMSLFHSERYWERRKVRNLSPPLVSGIDFACAIYRRFEVCRECCDWSMWPSNFAEWFLWLNVVIDQWNQICWMINMNRTGTIST